MTAPVPYADGINIDKVEVRGWKTWALSVRAAELRNRQRARRHTVAGRAFTRAETRSYRYGTVTGLLRSGT